MSRARSAPAARPIRVGAWARVELAGGDVWAGRVSYVSGEMVGLKAATILDGRVAQGDSVTLVVGEGESMVATQARVLSASGSFMRLARRESSEGLERRRALRVPIEQPIQVAYSSPSADRPLRCEGDLTDMSASGCALRAPVELPVGNAIAISMRIVGAELTLTGKIVRAWRTDEHPGAYAGVQFDPVPPRTTSMINRFLVEQLRETSSPLANCGRRSPRL